MIQSVQNPAGSHIYDLKSVIAAGSGELGAVGAELYACDLLSVDALEKRSCAM